MYFNNFLTQLTTYSYGGHFVISFIGSVNPVILHKLVGVDYIIYGRPSKYKTMLYPHSLLITLFIHYSLKHSPFILKNNTCFYCVLSSNTLLLCIASNCKENPTKSNKALNNCIADAYSSHLLYLMYRWVHMIYVRIYICVYIAFLNALAAVIQRRAWYNLRRSRRWVGVVGGTKCASYVTSERRYEQTDTSCVMLQVYVYNISIKKSRRRT